MTKARLSIRIPKSLKTKIRKAAILSGHTTMTDYVANVISEHSAAALNQHDPHVSQEGKPNSF